jgi:small subunit ribosomal protein S1
MKQLQPNPWDEIQKKYPIGTQVSGPITSVTDFGVFVKLEEGIEGLVYSSELAAERIEKPADHFAQGQQVTALVTKVEPSEQKISLSIRAVGDKAERAALKKLAAEQSTSQTTTLGDLLKEKLAAKGEEQAE